MSDSRTIYAADFLERMQAGHCDFGIIEAETEQQARDLAAQMAGYQSEAQMVETLEQPSEIVAKPMK